MPAVLSSLHKNFPKHETMSDVQSEMLPLLFWGSNMIIRSPSGQGKSFAIALWLLSLERSLKRVHVNKDDNTPDGLIEKPTTTALLLVCSVDLACQYRQWCETILKDAPVNKYDIVQTLYRCGEEEESEQIDCLQKFPDPHLLIATPARLLDIIANAQTKRLVLISAIRHIVIDEADQQIFVPSEEKTLTDMREGRFTTKPTPAEQLLNYIFHIREKSQAHTSLQQIWISTTANRLLRLTLMTRKWVRRLENQFFIGQQLAVAPRSFLKRMPSNIENFAMWVGKDGEIKDAILPEITAKTALEPSSTDDANANAHRHHEGSRIISYEVYKGIAELIRREGSFVQQALLLVDPMVSRRAVAEGLADFGLSAAELRFPFQEDVQVLVSNLGAVRGVDIPRLTHVVHIGSYHRSNDWIHAAGRIGRMSQQSQPARVFTVLRSEEDVYWYALSAFKLNVPVKRAFDTSEGVLSRPFQEPEEEQEVQTAETDKTLHKEQQGTEGNVNMFSESQTSYVNENN